MIRSNTSAVCEVLPKPASGSVEGNSGSGVWNVVSRSQQLQTLQKEVHPLEVGLWVFCLELGVGADRHFYLTSLGLQC